MSAVFSGGTLSFVAGTPFTYDPNDGNLLVDIQMTTISPTPNAGFPALFWYTNDTMEAAPFDSLVSLVSNFDGLNNQGIGLVTVFIPTPEPSTSILVATGLVALGLRRRRSRAAR